MKHHQKLTLFIGIFVWMLFSGSMVLANSINWYSYDEGIKISKAKGKKVFINFYANWCHYCKKMDKDTFSQSDVIDYMNENYIPIKVDTMKQKKLAMSYGVSGLPTGAFLTETGEKISNLPGYYSPEQFLPILKYMGTDSYLQMSFKKFLDQNKDK